MRLLLRAVVVACISALLYDAAPARSAETAAPMMSLPTTSHVFIYVSIEKRRFLAMLDTGSMTVLDNRVAEQLHLPLVSRPPVLTIRNAYIPMNASERAIRIDALGTPLELMNVPVTDLNDFTQVPGVRYDLILGHEFFLSRSLLLDYAHRRVRLADGIAACRSEQYRGSIAFADKMQPTLKATINGKRGDFFLDVGSARALVVNLTGYLRLRLVDELAYYMRLNPDPRAPVLTPVPIRQFLIGTYATPNKVLYFSTEKATRRADGRIGNLAFADTALIVDEPDRLYCVHPFFKI